MLTREELLKHPNYLLTTYQLDIYKQLIEYKEKNNLTQKDIATDLKVSTGYVSQILNGDFNFTLKKLIELGLYVGKIPYIEWVSPDEYWLREQQALKAAPKMLLTLNVFSQNVLTNKGYSPAESNKTQQVKEYVQAISSLEMAENLN